MRRLAVDLDQIHIPDPVSMELCRLKVRLDKLEKELDHEDLQYTDKTEG